MDIYQRRAVYSRMTISDSVHISSENADAQTNVTLCGTLAVEVPFVVVQEARSAGLLLRGSGSMGLGRATLASKRPLHRLARVCIGEEVLMAHHALC